MSCQQSVQLYNKYMGGVNMAEQLRKYYCCRRRPRKCWLPLFYFMLDISLVNSYILHHNTPHTTKLSIKEFILHLAAELMSKESTKNVLLIPCQLRHHLRTCFCEIYFPSWCRKSAIAESVARMSSGEEWCTAAWCVIQRDLFFYAQRTASTYST